MQLICCHVGDAQQSQPVFANNPYPKTISVSGSAEMEVIPDEIYVNIKLTEYQKRGETKKDIETLKTQFLESCRAANIPDSVYQCCIILRLQQLFQFQEEEE